MKKTIKASELQTGMRLTVIGYPKESHLITSISVGITHVTITIEGRAEPQYYRKHALMEVFS